ncbi:MAG: sulfate ABC transporter permease subunit CysT [Alphaproteobacteria bacterium]|jgi:sulfate transport system permease protein|uniref:sulfate ABC transporter permease subunit CysT n=1 Tax=Devosia sp. XGJD_8 TaxID=3391187 RepID=UPI001D8EB417|nr:sulfate ABC transporter permease subunit CysT [Alphaproteobacteria bacterium]MBU1561037.1 sulfate ABC transporter permease subunit CysT [Alphaproteobacteria bacterium]MBU2305011.1 sulfate ABC transporter permease subunit CysT [Alphaproteobacteria bacterium]MBU2370263.1 sulfate ABC transporter permease subunit CysT [Alphaproteobacteria bacterium]
MASRRSKHLLPGFGLTLGVSMLYLTIIIALPLLAMLLKVGGMGWEEFWRIVGSNRSLAAYRITFGSAFIAALFNGAFGLLLAWVLTRYSFPGKRILDALVDLPFALPTAVAGLVLVTLFADSGWYGQFLEPNGIKVNYTQLGIILAMAFTSIPFVVRTVQPVLEEVQVELEEAARTLGATRWQIFARVIWPTILPAFMAGCVLSFARSLGEFGAVVFIAGNLPGLTEIVSLLIFIRLEEYNYEGAAALAFVLLLAAFLTLLLTNALQAWQTRYADRSR